MHDHMSVEASQAAHRAQAQDVIDAFDAAIKRKEG
jgi:hypothetical protein